MIGSLNSYQDVYVARCGQQFTSHRQGIEHELGCQSCAVRRNEETDPTKQILCEMRNEFLHDPDQPPEVINWALGIVDSFFDVGWIDSEHHREAGGKSYPEACTGETAAGPVGRQESIQAALVNYHRFKSENDPEDSKGDIDYWRTTLADAYLRENPLSNVR